MKHAPVRVTKVSSCGVDRQLDVKPTLMKESTTSAASLKQRQEMNLCTLKLAVYSKVQPNQVLKWLIKTLSMSDTDLFRMF
jgi:hypothetical protein